MKICVCKNISDNEIHKYANIQDFVKATKATTMCGTCQKEVERIFNARTI